VRSVHEQSKIPRTEEEVLNDEFHKTFILPREKASVDFMCDYLNLHEVFDTPEEISIKTP
jgi:hypothetical protein